MTNEFSPAELDRRLETLESKLAYQEHWLDTLDQAVAEQERRLTTLEQLSALMRERLREQQTLADHSDEGAHRLQDDVPPHY